MPDLALLIEAAHRAGPIALRHWKAAPKIWEKPGLSPVTEADLEVNAMLADHLQGARPGYGWLSEETPDDARRLAREHVFIIDPIDGTRAFIAGEAHFSHSLAIARQGHIVAAVVFLPALDRLYAATLDGVATVNGQAINPSQTNRTDGANILMSKSNLDPQHWAGPVPTLTRSFRASLAYRLCLVADGSFDGMITLRPSWEWDIAAGSLISQRAGAAVTDRHGAALRFNGATAQCDGVLTANPHLHARLLGALKH